MPALISLFFPFFFFSLYVVVLQINDICQTDVDDRDARNRAIDKVTGFFRKEMSGRSVIKKSARGKRGNAKAMQMLWKRKTQTTLFSKDRLENLQRG